MPPPPPITILGTGAMATVCSILLSHQNRSSLTMWAARPASIDALSSNREQSRLLPGTRIPDSVLLTASDAQALAQPSLILCAIPTQYIRQVLTRLAPLLPHHVPIVSVAKGIETSTLLRPTQIIEDVLRQHARPIPPLATLSGPNIAAELSRFLPATAVAAATTPELARLVQSLFSTPWFRVYTNDDLIGVELAGATKNIIAIAAGILDGLGAGNNAKAALVTRGLVEITRLGTALGAKRETFQGLAGLGDLITTCVSPEGRNRSVGEKIGQGAKLRQVLESIPSVAEGVPTTGSVRELAKRHNVEMPITETLHDVLFHDKPVKLALTELMTRDPKPEL